jgi:acyl-CoA synthetase (AMP-forming)/AMP-acid ligase II
MNDDPRCRPGRRLPVEAAPSSILRSIQRGPRGMVGYLNAPEATAHCINEEGWLHTGDRELVEWGRDR